MGVECHPDGHRCWLVAELPHKHSHLDLLGTGILKNIYKTKGTPYIWWCSCTGIGYFFFNLFIFVVSGLSAWPGNLQEHFVRQCKVEGGGRRCAFYFETCPMFLCEVWRVSPAKLLKLQIAVWLIQVVTASEAETVTLRGTENLPL